MAIYVEGRGLVPSEAEPVGLLTEGAAGIAVIVLAIIALAGTSAVALASIATIVIGVGLMVQAFNSAAENAKVMIPGTVATPDLGGEMMVDCLCGVTGIVLGILALVGINAGHLVPSALIVFGGALLLSGAIGMRPKALPMAAPGVEARVLAYQGSAAASGMEILIGIAAIVLGILSLIFMSSWVLVLVGFIAVGAALLLVSATFSGSVLRLFSATA
jgi:hypothetical protein